MATQVADLNCAVEAQQVCMGKTGVIKWDPFWGNKHIQIYGDFEVFPDNKPLFGLVI